MTLKKALKRALTKSVCHVPDWERIGCAAPEVASYPRWKTPQKHYTPVQSKVISSVRRLGRKVSLCRHHSLRPTRWCAPHLIHAKINPKNNRWPPGVQQPPRCAPAQATDLVRSKGVFLADGIKNLRKQDGTLAGCSDVFC